MGVSDSHFYALEDRDLIASRKRKEMKRILWVRGKTMHGV